MDNEPTPHTEIPQPDLPPRPETDAPPRRSFREAARDGFHSARADAERTARTAAPKVKAAFSQAAYDLSYASAFAGFFGLTLVKEFIPEAVKSGFSEGAKRGRHAADSVASAAPCEAETVPPPATAGC